MSDRYKVASRANISFMDKVSVGALQVDVPYLILKMMKSTHSEFKENIKVITRDSKKVQFFSFLPPRFARKFTEEHIQGFMNDIREKRPPFLICRGMFGKGFDVDIHPFDLDIATKALKAEPCPRPTKPSAITGNTNDNEEIIQDDMEWLDQLVNKE